MVALVRLSAGCDNRPVTFSTISRARVLNEKGNFLKETVAARLKAEQVHKLHFSKQIPRWGGMRTSQLPANDTQILSRGLGDKFIQIAERGVAEMYVIACKLRPSTRVGIHDRIPVRMQAPHNRLGSLADIEGGRRDVRFNLRKRTRFGAVVGCQKGDLCSLCALRDN